MGIVGNLPKTPREIRKQYVDFGTFPSAAQGPASPPKPAAPPKRPASATRRASPPKRAALAPRLVSPPKRPEHSTSNLRQAASSAVSRARRNAASPKTRSSLSLKTLVSLPTTPTAPRNLKRQRSTSSELPVSRKLKFPAIDQPELQPDLQPEIQPDSVPELQSSDPVSTPDLDLAPLSTASEVLSTDRPATETPDIGRAASISTDATPSTVMPTDTPATEAPAIDRPAIDPASEIDRSVVHRFADGDYRAESETTRQILRAVRRRSGAAPVRRVPVAPVTVAPDAPDATITVAADAPDATITVAADVTNATNTADVITTVAPEQPKSPAMKPTRTRRKTRAPPKKTDTKKLPLPSMCFR